MIAICWNQIAIKTMKGQITMSNVIPQSILFKHFSLPGDEKTLSPEHLVQNDSLLETTEPPLPVDATNSAATQGGETLSTAESSEQENNTSPADPAVVQIILDNISIDASIVPRSGLDEYTVQQYAAALIRGERLPAISVEATDRGYRVLKGVLRYQAYGLRRDIYTEKYVGDFYDEPLPPVSDTELNTIPCIAETIPPDVHPMIFCMLDNLKHGKPLTPEDFRRVARQVYKDNEGAPISDLARISRMDRRTFGKYVRDREQAFEAKKKKMILDLHAQGVTQTEIARRLQERFPKGDGFSQQTVSDFLKKNGNLDTANKETKQVPPRTTQVSSVRSSSARDAGGDNSGNGPSDVTPPPNDENATGVGSSPKETPPSEPPRTIDLKVTARPLGDTFLIQGILSLPLSLQEKLRREAEELVDRIREEAINPPKQEGEPQDDSPDEPEQAPESPENTELAPDPVTEAKIPRPSRYSSVFNSSWGSRPVGYFS